MQIPEQSLAAALMWDIHYSGITMDHPKLSRKSWKKGFTMCMGIDGIM